MSNLTKIFSLDASPSAASCPGIDIFLFFFVIYLAFLRKLAPWMPPGLIPGAVAPCAPTSARHCSDLFDLSSSTLQPLSLVQHTAVRLIKDLIPISHAKTTSRQHCSNYTMASHSCLYRFQNLSPHVSYALWNLSIIHGSHGYAMFPILEDSDRSHDGTSPYFETNLKYGNRAFSVYRTYRSLPTSDRQCTSVAQFTSKLQSYLFTLYHRCKRCLRFEFYL